MNRSAAMMLAVVSCWMLAVAGCSESRGPAPASLARGEQLFSLHCAGCHPDGGNRITPQKTLHRLTLKANGISTPAGIVAVMRDPGQGMKRFDEKTIPDPDAFAIAAYVLATF